MRSKHLFTIALLSLLVFHGPGEAAESISFLDDWGATLNRARSQNRLVMVEFYTSWCQFCGKFEKDTLGDPRVAELAKEFVCARLDAEVQKVAAARYLPVGYPTVVFATPEGDEIVRVSGFREAEPFYKVIKTVRERGHEIADYMKALEDNPKDSSARVALGSIFLDLGLGDKAVEHLRAAMKAKDLGSDEKTRIQFNMGRAAAADQNFRKAIKTIEKLIDSDPDGVNAPEYMMELARIYEASGKSGKAEDLRDEIGSRFPDSKAAETIAQGE